MTSNLLLSENIDYKRPVAISMPESMLRLLDEKRGAVPRSTFVVNILQIALKDKGTKHA